MGRMRGVSALALMLLFAPLVYSAAQSGGLDESGVTKLASEEEFDTFVKVAQQSPSKVLPTVF